MISPDDIRIIEPASGVTYFDDFDDEDFRKIFKFPLSDLDLANAGSLPEVDRKWAGRTPFRAPLFPK